MPGGFDSPAERRATIGKPMAPAMPRPIPAWRHSEPGPQGPHRNRASRAARMQPAITHT